MAKFLETWFAKEVKEKQSTNQRAIAVDTFGKGADARCSVM